MQKEPRHRLATGGGVPLGSGRTSFVIPASLLETDVCVSGVRAPYGELLLPAVAGSAAPGGVRLWQRGAPFLPASAVGQRRPSVRGWLHVRESKMGATNAP